jgi:cytochrome c-type biogenesis protein CcmE
VTRGRLVLGVVVVGAALGWVAWRGLGDTLVYYRTPSEVVREVEAGQRVRLGGYVEPGSLRGILGGGGVTFIVSDGAARITVVGSGGVPSLFREGQGVVVEGSLGEEGRFRAERILVRHDADYRPPETPEG